MELLALIIAIWFFGTMASLFFKVTWWVFKAIVGFVGFMFFLVVLALLF